MKTKYIQRLVLIVVGAVLFSSCKKEVDNIFTMFKDVSIAFNNSDPRCVIDYKVINDKEEVWIDFTLTSETKDMFFYRIETSAGTAQPVAAPAVSIPEGQRRNFSFIYKVPASAMRDGKMSYRILALDAKGIYIGDGGKKVTVEQNPSYVVLARRDLYFPDSATKVLPSFISLSDAATYSYTDGAANSAKIDFGIFRYRYVDNAGTSFYAVNFFNSNKPANVFPIYDLSTWQKRATKFSAPVSNQTNTFTNTIVSSSTLETEAKKRTINLDFINATTANTGLLSGSAVYFLTPEGKYGMVLINSITSDLQKRPYINVSIKVQR